MQKNTKIKHRSMESRRYPYWIAIPGLIVFAVFFIVPSLFGLVFSFFRLNGFDFSKARFVFLENYSNAFILPTMRRAITNSFVFALITTFFKVLFGLVLAVILNRRMKSAGLLKMIFFSPAVISSVAVGLIFRSMMHPSKGLINSILNACHLGILAQNWLGDPKVAIYAASMIEIWKWSGFTMVIFLAGMQTISADYYEAAIIDGASGRQLFMYITFPLILPSFNNALIINLVGGFKVFDIIQSTTQGGPGTATEVFSTLMYKSFGSGRFGEGCAVAILLALVIALIAMPVYSMIEKREIEQ